MGLRFKLYSKSTVYIVHCDARFRVKHGTVFMYTLAAYNVFTKTLV